MFDAERKQFFERKIQYFTEKAQCFEGTTQCFEETKQISEEKSNILQKNPMLWRNNTMFWRNKPIFWRKIKSNILRKSPMFWRNNPIFWRNKPFLTLSDLFRILEFSWLLHSTTRKGPFGATNGETGINSCEATEMAIVLPPADLHSRAMEFHPVASSRFWPFPNTRFGPGTSEMGLNRVFADRPHKSYGKRVNWVHSD